MEQQVDGLFVLDYGKRRLQQIAHAGCVAQPCSLPALQETGSAGLTLPFLFLMSVHIHTDDTLAHSPCFSHSAVTLLSNNTF